MLPLRAGWMASDTVSILDGDTFVVSDRRGDVILSTNQPHGLFLQDTRFLSQWRLTIDGRSPEVLSTDDVNYFWAQFFLAPPAESPYEQATFSIMRKRWVGDGFHEDLIVLNHTAKPLELDLHLEAAADFADLFEVKDALLKKGEHYRSASGGRLVLGYRRERFVRETWISATAPEVEIIHDGLRFRVHVEPQGEWMTCLDVAAARHVFADVTPTVKYDHVDTDARPNMGYTLEEWIESAPKLDTDWRSLERTYERSLIDLAALRFYPPILPGMALPAAGLPWFMTVFGRDSLLTSYQALPFTPELAEATLRVLAAQQGKGVDPFRDEEPGKILHEIRFGEMTAFEERPHSPYYGSADSTPLFLILLDEIERWTGNAGLVHELEGVARAALGWIADYGDRDGDGYVEYERGDETGLENQCWKDSHDAILFADGSQSSLPRACCEIQGYVYDAKIRCARLARRFWGDAELADRLEEEAAELRRRFNEDFWLADRGYFALALDGHKRPVDSLTSNIGHLLWSGIVDDDKAENVAHHLVGSRLFSGWGVRTMAEGDGGYNPIGYHVGTVWPHDNSLVASGLARYGFHTEAAQIAFGMLEAAEFFDHRLPEAFAGYAREQTLFPVQYPTACWPQAWATGAPLLFIRLLVGLEPGEHQLAAPILPEGVGHLQVTIDRSPRMREPAAPRARSPQPVPSARRALTAVDGVREFFARFGEYVDPAAMPGLRGSHGFDVQGVGTWRVELDDGAFDISEGAGEADLILSLTEQVFLDIVRGEQNPMTAFLNGSVRMSGDFSLAPILIRIYAPAKLG
jgi:glycogen debranching enzyme